METTRTGHRARRIGVSLLAAVMLTAVAALTYGTLRHAAGSPPARHRATPRSPAAPARPTPTGPFRVVGLGDSVPAGSRCDCVPYVVQVGRQAAGRLGRAPVVDNLARPGLTTTGLVDQLRESAVRARLAEADLILVTIGANDFDDGLLGTPDCTTDAAACFRDALAAQRSRLSATLDQINALALRRRGRLLVTGYWNVLLDGQVGRQRGAGYVAATDALTLADNAVIASVAATHGATYVDLYAAFKGDGSDDTALLADDGDHPNAAGHALIARTLLAALG